MKWPTKSVLQLRREYMLRLADELTPDRIHRRTEHVSRSIRLELLYGSMISPMLGNHPVTSKLVYDKPDPKKLRRLLKSRSSAEPAVKSAEAPAVGRPGQPLRPGRKS
jgi:hypothetical protein